MSKRESRGGLVPDLLKIVVFRSSGYTKLSDFDALVRRVRQSEKKSQAKILALETRLEELLAQGSRTRTSPGLAFPDIQGDEGIGGIEPDDGPALPFDSPALPGLQFESVPPDTNNFRQPAFFREVRPAAEVISPPSETRQSGSAYRLSSYGASGPPETENHQAALMLEDMAVDRLGSFHRYPSGEV